MKITTPTMTERGLVRLTSALWCSERARTIVQWRGARVAKEEAVKACIGMVWRGTEKAAERIINVKRGMACRE